MLQRKGKAPRLLLIYISFAQIICFNPTFAEGTAVTPRPSKPMNVLVVASNKQLILSWNKSRAATSYRVCQSSKPFSTQSTNKCATLKAGRWIKSSGLSVTLKGLRNGMKYYFRVEALNNNGKRSIPSRLVMGMPLASILSRPEELKVKSGELDSTLKLEWAKVNQSDNYRICMSTKSFPADMINLCRELENGNIINSTDTSVSVSDLINGTTYFFRVKAMKAGGHASESSKIVAATPIYVEPPGTHPLNDTGITWCSDNSGYQLPCPMPGLVGQDAEYGRDFTENDDSDGSSGFSYTKLDEVGNPLGHDASDWSCVTDNVTGLIWEAKKGSETSGLHYSNDTFSWYNSEGLNAGGTGYENIHEGTCFGYNVDSKESFCNTQAFVERVNELGLCGKNSWRMPTREELAGLVNRGTSWPSIDTNYFSYTNNTNYWTSTPANANDAWVVHFQYGHINTQNKYTNFGVRLVHDSEYTTSHGN